VVDVAILRVLTVCTGNTCRSPMAAAILDRRLAEAGTEATVASAGTLGWRGRAATAHAVAVMEEMGLDISAHRSRRIDAGDLDVDLVLAMTRDHAGAVIGRDESLRSSVFLPSELVRLLGRRGTDDTTTGATMDEATMIRRLGEQREGSIIGRAAEEIADPAGEAIEVYRRTAQRLDRELSSIAAALVAYGHDHRGG
jgi:protein-tyrosine-phosphatase